MEGAVFVCDAVRASLAEAGRRAADLTELIGDIGALLETSARDRIEVTNVTPDGVPWPKSFRVEAGQGGKTLLETARLRDSIVHEAGPREAVIGSNVIYAAIHQFGGVIRPKAGNALVFRLADGSVVKAGSVAIPARPYLGISEADEAMIVQDLVPAWLLTPLEGGDVV